MSLGTLRAQQDKYGAPLDSPLYLSGNFCQLREGHFHFGLDIPTNDTIWPVYAVSDGYISRVFSADYGYGNALFIKHKDKNTSVYAHLSRFREDIAHWCISTAYRLHQNNVDIFPKASQFPIKKGMLIGWSGSSGASTGPHLHLEIRNPANELLNPVPYFNIPDTMPPLIEEVILREVGGGLIRAIHDTFYLQHKTAYLSACIYDRAIFPENKLAPTQIVVCNHLGDTFQVHFNQFSFAQNPGIVRHVNRTVGKIFQNKFHRLWIEPGNMAPFYRGKAITNFPEGISELYIWAKDHTGKTTFKTYYISVKQAPEQMQPSNYYPSSSLAYYNEDSTMHIQVLPEPNPDSIGVLWGIEEDSVYMTQGGIPSVDDFIPKVALHMQIPPEMQNIPLNKLYIGYKNEEGNYLFCAGKPANKNHIKSAIKVPGIYKLCYDTTPPYLSGIRLLPDSTLELTIMEQESGLYTYQLFCNGIWERCLRNPLSGHIIFRPKINNPIHPESYTISLTDKCKNKAIYNFQFPR